jgi:hypothetical protein
MTSISMADPLTEESSQEGSVFDDADLIGTAAADMVAAQLAAAGQSLSLLVCIDRSYRQLSNERSLLLQMM